MFSKKKTKTELIVFGNQNYQLIFGELKMSKLNPAESIWKVRIFKTEKSIQEIVIVTDKPKDEKHIRELIAKHEYNVINSKEIEAHFGEIQLVYPYDVNALKSELCVYKLSLKKAKEEMEEKRIAYEKNKIANDEAQLKAKKAK